MFNSHPFNSRLFNVLDKFRATADSRDWQLRCAIPGMNPPRDVWHARKFKIIRLAAFAILENVPVDFGSCFTVPLPNQSKRRDRKVFVRPGLNRECCLRGRFGAPIFGGGVEFQ